MCGKNIQTKPREVILKKRTKENENKNNSIDEESKRIDCISWRVTSILTARSKYLRAL